VEKDLRDTSSKPTLQAVTRAREQRRPDQDARLRRQTIELVKAVTGTTITDEWAGRVLRHVLDGKRPGDPWRYVRGAILGSGDPCLEFLPIGVPGYV
jgi:hypothetical protein